MSEQEVDSASQQLEKESGEELDSLLIQASQQFEEIEEKSEEEIDSLLIQASQQFEAAQDSYNKQQGRFGLPVTTQGLMEKVN